MILWDLLVDVSSVISGPRVAVFSIVLTGDSNRLSTGIEGGGSGMGSDISSSCDENDGSGMDKFGVF